MDPRPYQDSKIVIFPTQLFVCLHAQLKTIPPIWVLLLDKVGLSMARPSSKIIHIWIQMASPEFIIPYFPQIFGTSYTQKVAAQNTL